MRHYSINAGLPSSETYAAFQDRKGYIWVASDMGVSRFDGYNFKVYTTADGLTDNTVFNFFEDHAGRVWFYTFSGRLSYFLNDSIYGKSLQINETLRSFLGSGFIDNMMVDAHDTVWLATSKGLVKVIPDIKHGGHSWDSVEVINHDATFLVPGGYITVKSVASSSTLLCHYNNGLKTSEVIIAKSFSGFIRAFLSTNNSILVQFGSSLVNVESGGSTTEIDDLTGAISSLPENDSLIWISKSHTGVQLFSAKNLLSPRATFLKSFSVTGILKDKEGGYWFTTLEDGVFYLSSAQFKYFQSEENKWDYNQAALKVVGGRVWVLTGQGIFEFMGLEGFKKLKAKTEVRLPLKDDTRYLNALKLTDGGVCISANTGLFLNSKDQHGSGRIVKMKNPDNSNAESRLAIEDSLGNIWSLNHRALFKISPQNGEVIKVIGAPSRAEALCENQRGEILVGTVNGLYRVKNDSFCFLGSVNPVFKNRIVDLKRFGKTVIAATRGSGIFVLTDDSVYTVSTLNGMRSDMCRSVFVGDKNIIWAGTNNGLSEIKVSFNPFKASVINFTISDGLPSNDISQVVKLNHTVWVLTKKGLAAFEPEKVIRNKWPPPVYLTRLKIDNALLSFKTYTVLSSSTNFIGIDFVGLTYKNAGHQTYKYKLENYDSGWTYTGNTFVQFTKLPPGKYKFIVFCVNLAGVESIMPATYSFVIKSPFYRTWWFGVFMFLSSLAAVIIVAVVRVKGIRRQEAYKTELNRKIANLELQALRAQMNPHFIFNCLNAIQDFILKNDSTSAKHYLLSFSKLIRKTLDNSRRQNIRLMDEVDFLNIYLELESMRFIDKFNYQIKLEPGLENILIPAMILQPFVENAVRHSRIGSLPRQGKLTIEFFKNGTNLVCVIDDNGIGLNASLHLTEQQPERREAHALDIISERIRSINEVHRSNIGYTVKDKSELDVGQSGTRVELIIPLD